MPKIKVVAVRVGQAPQVEEIGSGLESFQKFVGGYIQMVPAGGEIELVCNEDGIALGLPQNGCGILGPYFFVKHDEEGDAVSLSQAEIDAILAQATARRQIRHPGSRGITVLGFGTAEELFAALERLADDQPHKTN